MQTHPVKFHGNGFEYFGIWIVNILLTILTLGIYSAWAKVRNKRYLYGNTEIDGDRFDYLAKPIQILIGRIIAVVIVGLLAWASSFNPMLYGVLILVVAALFPFIMVRNLRFDRRMTQYRNVRFDFTGGYKEGYKVFLLIPVLAYIAFFTPFLVIGMLGENSSGAGVLALLFIPMLLIAGPYLYAYVMVNITSFMVNHTEYGNLKFGTAIETKTYFKISIKAFLIGMGVMALVGILAAVGIGSFAGDSEASPFSAEGGFNPQLIASFAIFYIVIMVLSFVLRAYYTSQIRNYLFSQTQIDEKVQLKSDMLTWPYAWLIISNLLLVIFTLGLGRPWAVVRHANYLANVTTLEGDLGFEGAFDNISDDKTAIADEVTQALDFDISLI